MDKYGFVYIWRDRKRNRYYVGSHWGNENDRYICSSNWMRTTYWRRPEDFKRRIISRIYTNRADTYLKEDEWLNLIKTEELGKRYYNFQKKVGKHWSETPDGILKVIKSPNFGMKNKHHTEKSKKLMSEHSLGQIAWNKGLKGVQVAWNKGIEPTEKMKEMLRNQASSAGKKRWELARINNWKMPDEIVKQIADSKSKEYIITDPKGNEFEIKNLAAWCKENKVDQGNMNAIARGKGKTCKGYKVRYKND